MTEPIRGHEDDDDLLRLNIFQTVQDNWRFLAGTTLAVTAVVALVGALYLVWWQPVRRTWEIEFRPTFAGASEGRYPNGLVFSPSDITAAPIIDQVFARNDMETYCSPEAFRSGFFIDQQSTQFAFLDLEYQARLSDPRLNAVDRERIVEEYRSRKEALPLHYRLVFFRPPGCSAIPGAVVAKALTDVLTVWAEDSESRRGVLNLRVQVLTPGSLDIGLTDEESRLIRADLIRTALRRLEANVREVEEMPGASVVRVGENDITFAEVRMKFRDLIQARLEPLLIAAGRGLGRNSAAWVDEAFASATSEQQVAEGKAQAYLDTLREYSGMSSAAPATGVDSRQSPTASSDVQTLTPQIDRTFIDRIVEMSEQNTTFRQEMARFMVEANVDAVEAAADVRHYARMAESINGARSEGLPPSQVDERLSEIIAEGKRLTQQFNDLYDEFSRVSMRSAAMMFQVGGPVRSEILRDFSTRSLMLLLAGTFALSLLLAFGAALLRERLIRDRVSSPPPSVSV